MVTFVSGISIVCFAASYGVAFLFEISRLIFRSGLRGAAMVAFAAAGFMAHTLFLGWRAATEQAVPLSSAFDWYLLAAWSLAAGYLWLTLANPRTPVGLFMLPVVLGLICAAQWASREPFSQSPATQVWGAIHGIFNLLGSVAVAIGAVSALMWLIQADRLGKKEPPIRGFRMPSLEKLAQITSRTAIIAAWATGAGFASGLVLNAVNRQRGLLDTVPWTDPVVVRMGALMVWLVIVAIVARVMARSPHGSRRVAILSMISFGLLVMSIVWGLLGNTRHGMPPQQVFRVHSASRWVVHS